MCVCVLCCGSLPELGPPLRWGDCGRSGVCWVGMRCSAVFTIAGGSRVLSFLCLLVALVCMYIDKAVTLWEATSLLGWQELTTLPLLTFSRESECSSRSVKSAKSSPWFTLVYVNPAMEGSLHWDAYLFVGVCFYICEHFSECNYQMDGMFMLAIWTSVLSVADGCVSQQITCGCVYIDECVKVHVFLHMPCVWEIP